MKKIILLTAALTFALSGFAQESFKDRLKRKLEEAKDKKIDNTIDKILTKSEEKLDKTVNDIAEGDGKGNRSSTKSTSTGNKIASTAPAESKTVGFSKISVASKFDFIPGEKVLYYDDFSTTSVGDFPLGWNTNSSAELVNLSGSEDKWLSITKDGFFQPDLVTNMPDNYTLEFNVFNRYRSSNILRYSFIISASENARRDISEEYLPNMFAFNWAGCAGTADFFVKENDEVVLKNEGINIAALASNSAAYDEPVFAKFSLWRQKSRLRLYINETKVLDIPQAFDPKKKYNVFKIGAKYMNYATADSKDEFMLANIRYSVGAPDTRNKLITEGKLITRGILFDVNSDEIKPESNGVLKDIANVLKENPSVKVKIIGHTDSDGDANLNLSLSKKRADAVKASLTSVFGIDANRFVTDGKGATQPSDPNTTPQGKANNRRVEFIKL